MAYHVVEVMRSFLVIVEADSKIEAEIIASGAGLNGESMDERVLDSYKTLDEARDSYKYCEVDLEIDKDGYEYCSGEM